MELLFVGGPLDGLSFDLEPPLTETLAYVGDAEVDSVSAYEPPVRPYFLHSVLLNGGIAPIYSTTPDWNEFADQLARTIRTVWLPPPVSPSQLPHPADRILAIEAHHE